MQPLGSFFPQGFLMPPDRAPLVDAGYFILFHSYLPFFCFRGGEGVNLRVEVTCVYPCLYVWFISYVFLETYLISYHHHPLPTLYSFSIITRLISVCGFDKSRKSSFECFLSGEIRIGFHRTSIWFLPKNSWLHPCELHTTQSPCSKQ